MNLLQEFIKKHMLFEMRAIKQEDIDKFIEMWNYAGTLDEAIRKVTAVFSMTQDAAINRANYLRQHKFIIKRFTKTGEIVWPVRQSHESVHRFDKTNPQYRKKFAEFWQHSKSAIDVANNFNISTGEAHRFADDIRQNDGVELKQTPSLRPVYTHYEYTGDAPIGTHSLGSTYTYRPRGKMSVRQIADILDISAPTVTRILQRIKVKSTISRMRGAQLTYAEGEKSSARVFAEFWNNQATSQQDVINEFKMYVAPAAVGSQVTRQTALRRAHIAKAKSQKSREKKAETAANNLLFFTKRIVELVLGIELKDLPGPIDFKNFYK